MLLHYKKMRNKWDAAYSRNEALLIEWENDQITQNEWRTANGRDTITGGDIYYTQWKKNNPDSQPIQSDTNLN